MPLPVLQIKKLGKQTSECTYQITVEPVPQLISVSLITAITIR